MPFDILYSVHDVLEHYGFAPAIDKIEKKFGHLPFVALVPEGRENEAAEQLRRLKYIEAACPDFVTRPSSAIEINRTAIDDAIAGLDAAPIGSDCGRRCTVAVLDTGIDPALLDTPQALNSTQYDAQTPAEPGTPPSDSIGHGTLVGHIINRIAPGAHLISIKTMDRSGSVGALITALYLSEAAGPCDVINMSLSVGCEPVSCKICGSKASVNSEQLRCFFDRISTGWSRSGSATTMIAAAGNGYRHLAMPACFPGVIAVGAFDLENRQTASYSRYLHVPSEHYVLAPGGRQDVGSALAMPLRASYRTGSGLHGTSYAAAFVTGVSARYFCGLRGGDCAFGELHESTEDPVARLHSRLRLTADRAWVGYTPDLHGVGLIRYRR